MKERRKTKYRNSGGQADKQNERQTERKIEREE